MTVTTTTPASYTYTYTYTYTEREAPPHCERPRRPLFVGNFTKHPRGLPGTKSEPTSEEMPLLYP